MIQGFHELVVGDVLVAPFVAQGGVALGVLLLLRPLLARLGFDRLFSAAPAAMLCLYVVLVAVLVVIT
jgi:Protein of unknown function (DUF1656)